MASGPNPPESQRNPRGAGEDGGSVAHRVDAMSPNVIRGETSSEDLVARMATGDEAALSELYDRLSGRVYALLVRILGDEADAADVLLRVFTRAWRRAADYDRARSTVLTWLSVVARTRALEVLRARRSRREWIHRAGQATPERAPAMDGGHGAQAANAETREMRRDIDDALATLHQDQRRAIDLAYFHGLSQSQIADLVDAPLGTIKTRMRTGMRKLRDHLEPLNADDAG